MANQTSHISLKIRIVEFHNQSLPKLDRFSVYCHKGKCIKRGGRIGKEMTRNIRNIEKYKRRKEEGGSEKIKKLKIK